ncbi:hypothetical protein M7I_7273 [Glarea lozoyensis 74030]|uniref:Uncharacterized protein n=1 Tax=Glarea lozoyensis (strain ATCC 74030 / MF5533) TaxID=1104152 RepID=H0EWU9_GLAL7|nr:hypothetical protein M7I_7273 [Glarea lozoyensis 74030]
MLLPENKVCAALGNPGGFGNGDFLDHLRAVPRNTKQLFPPLGLDSPRQRPSEAHLQKEVAAPKDSYKPTNTFRSRRPLA